jgi:hypothetical protein
MGRKNNQNLFCTHKPVAGLSLNKKSLLFCYFYITGPAEKNENKYRKYSPFAAGFYSIPICVSDGAYNQS